MVAQDASATARPSLIIVSGYGKDPVTPRGQRTKHLKAALDETWDTSLIAMPGKTSVALPDGSTPWHAGIRRLLLSPLRRLLLDRWEPWSVRHLARWKPEADAALLVASPWSPAIYASRRLVKAGIPYVMDVGDPWVLTAGADSEPPTRRELKGERFLWENARGAVVTTAAQRDALRQLYPELPILVRPNGFNPIERALTGRPREAADSSTLRIAHFGMLSETRIDLLPLLTELSNSGRWETVVFSQFGHDFGIGLDSLSIPTLRVEHHTPLPWSEVVEHTVEFDAVLAVTYPYPNTMLLPSKAIEYSTLPVPRIALVNPQPEDALRQYAESHAGWLAISNGEPGMPARVLAHLDREWSASELAPSPENAWPAVATTVAEFFDECLDANRGSVRTG